MKKNYVSPLAVEVSIDAASMLATSMKINNGKSVNTSDNGAQLGNEHRGEWGNLWQ